MMSSDTAIGHTAEETSQVVDCAVYVDGRRQPGTRTPREGMAEVRRHRRGFVWCGLHEPNDEHLQEAVAVFGLPAKALDYALHTHHRAKLAIYDDLLCMVLKTVHYVEHDSPTTANEIVDTGEIITFIGRDFVLTVRHAEHSGLRGLRAELEAAPERLRLVAYLFVSGAGLALRQWRLLLFALPDVVGAMFNHALGMTRITGSYYMIVPMCFIFMAWVAAAAGLVRVPCICPL